MQTISDFEIEEYSKMISSLDLSDEGEDKSIYFEAWNFGEIAGEFVTTNESIVCSDKTHS